MTQEWDRNMTSIVRETESNLARVRERLDGSEYKSFTTGLYTNPINFNSGADIKYSTPTKPLTSTMHGGNDYDSYQTTGYRGILSHNALQDDYGGGGNSEAISDHSPALVAMLTEKIDAQNKVMQDLVRQVKSLERDREQTSSRLRNMEREVLAVNRRLEESGVHLETERKMERAQQEMRMQMTELQSRVHAQRQSGATESVYSDDVLSSLTRELHDFKRHTHEECDSLHRELESMRTRIVKTEVDVCGQQADSKDVNRRLDRLDRNLTTVSDSQRLQVKDINQSVRQKHSNDRELDQLRLNVQQLSQTVTRLDHDNAMQTTTSHLPSSRLLMANEAASSIKSTRMKPKRTDFKPKKRPHKRERHQAKLKPFTAAGAVTLNSSSDDDNDFDISTTISLDSSSSSSSDDDSAIGKYTGAHYSKSKVPPPVDDVNELLSDLDDNLLEKDNDLDIADLTDTLSISSVDLDSDLL